MSSLTSSYWIEAHGLSHVFGVRASAAKHLHFMSVSSDGWVDRKGGPSARALLMCF